MRGARRRMQKDKHPRSPRASVTFSADTYELLAALAQQKKVSVAWVVRDAAEKYIADQWPLFTKREA